MPPATGAGVTLLADTVSCADPVSRQSRWRIDGSGVSNHVRACVSFPS